jgi:hypothetical protein
LIEKCPSNGFRCDQSYEIPKEKKLVGFEYEQLKNHPSYGHSVLPDIKPIIIYRKNV